ncbi:hypothetical protein LCGC14_0742530 [marine sediment metagenome]|uniref:Leucine-rich repeat domain-containing protein n=1 Tax=marine sediment metagenome TaxID=412755 RepID=A0A0F9QRC5_9ZZZZ
MREFKVNNLITLRLIEGETVLFVNNREFKQCKILLINVPVDDESMDEIEETESIDEIAEYLDVSMDFKYIDINPEEEFTGHCSNLQVWAENLYDTDLLHKSLAFPLLKALSEEGDTLAKQRFAEEIARRYKNGNKTVRRFLFEEGYLSCLSNDDILNGILTLEEAIFMEKIMAFGEQYSIFPSFEKLKGVGSKNKTYLSVRDAKIRELEIVVNKDLNRIPREIENLNILYRLNIFIQEGYNGNLFGEEFCLPSLNYLTIFCDSTAIIPDSFHYFPNLKYLYVRGFELLNKPTISFENSFAKLTKLEELHLHSVYLKRIPDSLLNLKKLERLSLSKTTLKTLPVSLICNLRSLRSFDLKYNSDLEIQKIEIEKLEKKIEEFKYLSEF